MSSSGGGGAVPAWKLRMMQQQKGAQASPAAMPSSGSAASSVEIPKGSTTSSTSSKNISAADARAKLKKKMEAATLDPNLPPAFKVAMKGRLAFAKQQERRKNNDTWVSLNSSHINQESTRPMDYVDTGLDSDDDSFASMGEDSFIEEGEEENED